MPPARCVRRFASGGRSTRSCGRASRPGTASWIGLSECRTKSWSLLFAVALQHLYPRYKPERHRLGETAARRGKRALDLGKANGRDSAGRDGGNLSTARNRVAPLQSTSSGTSSGNCGYAWRPGGSPGGVLTAVGRRAGCAHIASSMRPTRAKGTRLIRPSGGATA